MSKRGQGRAEKSRPSEAGVACATGGKPFKARGKKLEFQGVDALDPKLLEAFDYAFPGREIDIITTTEEFTTVCPFSCLPDFGRLTISYVPDRLCVELR